MDTQTKYVNAMNRLAKWRAHFAGWQLGTRPKGDPECDAVREHREATMIQRAEISTLTRLLIEKGVFTFEEFMEVAADEAEELSKLYSKRWPGITATDAGLSYTPEAAESMKGWKP